MNFGIREHAVLQARLEPVFELASEAAWWGAKQFEGTPRNHVKEFLHRRSALLKLLEGNGLQPVGLDDWLFHRILRLGDFRYERECSGHVSFVMGGIFAGCAGHGWFAAAWSHCQRRCLPSQS